MRLISLSEIEALANIELLSRCDSKWHCCQQKSETVLCISESLLPVKYFRYGDPLAFACLQLEAGIQPLGTSQLFRAGQYITATTGVAFARADSPVASIMDLKNKILASPGFFSPNVLAVILQFQSRGLNVFTDMSQVSSCESSPKSNAKPLTMYLKIPHWPNVVLP